jgi:hypothetical protein
MSCLCRTQVPFKPLCDERPWLRPSALIRATTRWPLRRQRRSRRKLAAAHSCGGLRCTVRTRFESISGLAHQRRSLSPCGACAMRLGTTRQYWLRCQAEPKDCEPDDCHDSNETRAADWPANIHLRSMAESRRQSGAIPERRWVLLGGMRVAHRNRKGNERYRRRHSQDNCICNPTSHARQLTIHAREPVLRLHNLRPASLSYGCHNPAGRARAPLVSDTQSAKPLLRRRTALCFRSIWVEVIQVPAGSQISALSNDSTAGTLNVTELS